MNSRQNRVFLVSWARGCAAGLTAWDVTDEYAARLDGGE